MDAHRDPDHVKCASELSHGYKAPLKFSMTHAENRRYKEFVDAMFHQLSLPYTTSTKATVYIKADREMVTNIAKCFAKADRLDVELAKRTKGYFIEALNLLAITIPTGLPEKPAFRNVEHTLSIIAQIGGLWQKSWSKMLSAPLDGVETAKTSQISTLDLASLDSLRKSSELTDWAVTNCTAGLHRIGKGQLPAGLIPTCRSPKITKHMAGGNDQLQRIRLGGIAKGKDGATATNSSCANVAFVAGTHQIATSMITYAKQPTSSRSDDAHRKRR
jgi:hypothetical protein